MVKQLDKQTLRIGMIGLDTSHVVAFTSLLNDPNHESHVRGGKVTVAYPGGSPDLVISHSRVEKFTHELAEKFGVVMVDSPEAVAEQCDILFIESVDGRVHMDQLRRTLPFGRPTFIDKPLAHSHAEASEIFRISREAQVPLMSCSSLRYAEALVAACADAALGDIGGCDVFGPMNDFQMPPDWFWYGIHIGEIIYRIMGTGCSQLQIVNHPDGEVVTALWVDGRIATARALRGAHTHTKFGVTLHRSKGAQYADLTQNQRPAYASLLAAIMKGLPYGKSDIPDEQTLELMRFLEAANESRRTGNAVTL